MDDSSVRLAVQKWVSVLEKVIDGGPLTQAHIIESVLAHALDTWEYALCARFNVSEIDEISLEAFDTVDDQVSEPAGGTVITAEAIDRMNAEINYLDLALKEISRDRIVEQISILSELRDSIRDAFQKQWHFQLQLADTNESLAEGDEDTVIDADQEHLKWRLRCLDLARELQELNKEGSGGGKA